MKYLIKINPSTQGYYSFDMFIDDDFYKGGMVVADNISEAISNIPGLITDEEINE